MGIALGALISVDLHRPVTTELRSLEEEDRGPGPFRRLSALVMILIERARSARAEPIHDRDAPAGVAPGWRLALILAIPVIAVLLLLVLRDAGRMAGLRRQMKAWPMARRSARARASLPL